MKDPLSQRAGLIRLSGGGQATPPIAPLSGG